MATLTLPYADGTSTDGAVFEMDCNDRGGTAIQGKSLGSDQSGSGGTGLAGSAESGGIGVRGEATGFDRYRDPGTGVWGSADSGGTGVFGEASGIDEADGSPGWGIAGYSPDGGIGVRGEGGGNNGIGVDGYSDSGGFGVRGQAQGGTGVAGYASNGGVGVHGESGGGFAMSAQGPTTQSRASGGWVKAIAHVIWPKQGFPSIDRSFNSQSLGTGFNVYYVGVPGVLVIDFGFKVKDRYVLATPEFQAAFYIPLNPKDLSQGFEVQPFDQNGNDTAAITLTPTPPVASAMISFPGDNSVQIESFTMQMKSQGGGAFGVSYQRANHNLMVTVF